MTDAVEDQPLSGDREALVQAVVAEMLTSDSVGVIFVGESGIGKSFIARHVVDQVQDSLGVLSIRGGVGLRSIPYGALSPFLGELTPADVESPAAIPRRFMRVLERESKTRSVSVIFVDDAHDLDDESALLIMQLATARKVKVLATARQVPGLGSEFARAVKDGLLVQHAVEPLTLLGVQEVCSRMLGGSVLTGTVRLLSEVTRGNPLLLTMLVHQGRTEGYLVEENGVWRSRGPRPPVSAPLADLILHGVRPRSGAELRALEFLSVAGTLPRASLEAGVHPTVLAQLVQEQLLEVDPEDERLVSLRHPLHAEAIRGSLTTPRMLELVELALATLPESPHRFREQLRHVSWALMTSPSVGDPVLLRAARLANRLHDPASSLHLLAAIRPALPGSDYLLEAAWAQRNLKRYDLARVLVDESLGSGPDPLVAREAMVLSLLLHLRAGSSVEVIREDTDRWVGLLHGPAGRVGPSGSASEQVPVRLLRAAVNAVGGDLSTALELDTEVMDSDLPVDVQAGGLLLRAHALTRTGRPRAAIDALAEARRLIVESPEQLLTHRDAVIAEHALALVSCGSWDEARELLNSTYSGDPESIGMFSGWFDVIEGSLGLRTGRFDDARRRLLLAVEAFRELDDTLFVDWTAGAAAYACAVAGDAQGARALMENRRGATVPSDAVGPLMGEVYAAAAHGQLGNQDAVPYLRRLAEQAQGQGLLLVAATALDHALLLGDRSALRPLADVTQDFDGGQEALLHRFATASIAGDRDALVSEGEAARERGYLPLALRALEEAALVGPPGPVVRKIERQAASVRAELAVVPGSTGSSTATATTLTRREEEIVELVAAGHTNREIAELQSISARTVEGHLYRIFAKLGINKREALQQRPEGTSS
ncbi:hypothetical protein GM708_10330 [Vibrio cholerae]|nr:hypothetical protein [Vibrio cholerae]